MSKINVLMIFGLLMFLPAIQALETQSFVEQKITNPEKLCYVMTEKTVLVNDGTTMRDIYSDSSDWNIYPIHDQWTLNDLLETDKVEISLQNVAGKEVIVFRDYGKDVKSKEEVFADQTNPLTQLCMLSLPRTRAYHTHATAPTGGEKSFVKILGLQNGYTYSRNETLNYGIDGNSATYTIGIWGSWIDLTATFTPEQLADIGIIIGNIYDLDLSLLPDDLYYIISGETYSISVVGDDGSTDSVNVSFSR